MKAHWIIENFAGSEDFRGLVQVQAVRDTGRECFIIGSHNRLDFDLSEFKENECVIVQGSIQMMKNVASHLPKGCFPVAYNAWDKFLCSAYYPDSLFCVDICQDADGDYWLLELTSFSPAGLYSMQKDLVAKRVSEIVEMEYQEHFKRAGYLNNEDVQV